MIDDGQDIDAVLARLSVTARNAGFTAGVRDATD